MSDFIYSNLTFDEGILANKLKSIYSGKEIDIIEIHGQWGSIAISKNIYNGFQFIETNQHICFIIGGPVLNFTNNDFIIGDNNSSEGTQAIYNRVKDECIKWDEDLNGPFVFFLLDKINHEIDCITDLMSFIPVYYYKQKNKLMMSTHIDVLARSAKQENNIDLTSEVDFILNGIITYPYTRYKEIKQMLPASINKVKNCEINSDNYWLPLEEGCEHSKKETAIKLREAMNEYINKITGRTEIVAHFISGGEDSRFLAGLLPDNITKDAFVFLDQMNWEGVIAKKASIAYGSTFHLATRSPLHYLNILPEGTKLVGSGAQYTHAHTFGFQEKCHFDNYPAVFGGLFSDALLKGSRIKKRGSVVFKKMIQIKKSDYSVLNSIQNNFFTPEILKEINKRRAIHYEYVKKIRPHTVEEWFELWPSSMNASMPNLYVNRRLFRSYEPFMTKDVIKVSACLPEKWKLNRVFFRTLAKPILKKTSWLVHSEGIFPYLPWYLNFFIQPFVLGSVVISKKIGIIKGNQGPWGEWKKVIQSEEWNQFYEKHINNIGNLQQVLNNNTIDKTIIYRELSVKQRINLLQILYSYEERED